MMLEGSVMSHEVVTKHLSRIRNETTTSSFNRVKTVSVATIIRITTDRAETIFNSYF